MAIFENFELPAPTDTCRVDVGVDPAWLPAGATVVGSTPGSGSRVRLEPGADAARTLDAIRARVDVADFAVGSPPLSELFRAATMHPAAPGDGA